ncbi:sensor histidine kinase [Pseudomonas sp. LP_7_YM]|uniref:sensor histidine kinase n=1 Tax=Pseudomonas sp. LP_7_YM TaxID=2485137 RepID=UPI00105D0A8E|nr:sensor histidine kinase [Pseudomonas sp. LP_7_YM]TDV61258.1 signal transduction histidine kinase [Pseudomonas sp. LP_7_YM]
MRSIQRRLSLGLISVLLIIGLVLAQISLWLFEVGLQRYLESGLRNDAELLLVAIVRGPNGLQLDEHRLSPGYLRPYSGHYFRIDFDGGHWRSRSLWDLELPQPEETGLHADLELEKSNQSLLLLHSEYRKFGQQISITVARDYTPVQASFALVQRIGLGLGLAGLILILVLQRITVRRALRPLDRAREQIFQLQQGQRSQLDEQVPLELEPLVAQINHLLAHTENSLKRSRNALGNLGHALKTPLAVLLSLAEGQTLDQHPQLRATLREQLQQIQQRLERELNRARLSGDALPGARLDCDAELPGLFSTLRMIHGEHLQLSNRAAPGLILPWDREDLLELLGNLLDNACKWADSLVCLSVTQPPGGYCLLIEDDGPGIPEGQRAEVLGRGSRLDEQVTGHGLGLGIVKDIVAAWGGKIQLLDSALGGLQVRIDLPDRQAVQQGVQ